MKLDVIIPVGPEYENLANRAVNSVAIAEQYASPFVEVNVIRIDDTKGQIGRSAARNSGVRQSEAPWLFFLDADDLMHPGALASFESESVGLHQAAFGLTTELVEGNVVTRYQVPRIHTYDELIQYDPFLTIKMGHFVMRDIAIDCPFNTEMDVGEDWEYYLRLWSVADCVKVNAPFFIKCRGLHSTGPRSATGQQWNQAVNEQLIEAREEWTRTQRTSQ